MLELLLKEKIVHQIMDYLDQFPDREEGGILLGKRDDKCVEVTEFIPVASEFPSWNTEDIDPKTVPDVSIGYFPDPVKVLKIRERVAPFDKTTDIVIVGFVHNHMNFLPNPSHWDLTRVAKIFGYLMPIYSNGTKELKVWQVITTTEKDSEWESNTLKSSAQVVLAATYVRK